LHRIWAFLAGLPVGVLGALAAGAGSWTAFEVGAPAGGAALLLAAAAAARFASPEAERGAHLARAASVGLAALPAAAGAWLGLLPGAGPALAVVALALAVRFALAMRATGPGGGMLRQLGAAAGALSLGAAAYLAASALLAAFAGPARETSVPESRARYVYGVDAGVALGPDPGCEPAVAETETLAAGANPATQSGDVVWYDAPGPDGRRQIHRLDRRSGAVRCWTCEEPGRNRRPRLARSGASLVFETDRYATPFEPVNWELQLASARGDVPAGSRRLTFDAAPDAFGSLDPGGRLVVWSSGRGGRYAVATAPLRSGHGGLVLGGPTALLPGGAAWIAPLAWSPDARTLVALRGDPFGAQEAFAFDPATDRTAPLTAPGGARVVAASFSGDGTTLAVATTRPAAAAAAVPKTLGFLVARLAALAPREPARFRGTGVRIGPPWADALAEVALGDVARFGHPTGIALEADGRAFVLGQRHGKVERLLRVELRCP
jgi:hypothetical protein